MRTKSTFRQVMPGLVRVHTGVGSETCILQSYYLQDLDVIPLSRGQKVPGRRGEPPVTDVALRTPTKSFSQIKVLLKLRWLLRLLRLLRIRLQDVLLKEHHPGDAVRRAARMRRGGVRQHI